MDNTHTYGRITPGLTTIGIGAIHQVVGAAAGLGLLPAVSGSTSAPLLDLWRSGIIGQAEADPLRMATVWFLLFGFLLIFAGMVLHRLEFGDSGEGERVFRRERERHSGPKANDFGA